MADPKTLNDLFVHKLRRIYDAEQRLVKALPKMSKASNAPELKQAFDAHLRQTETHVDRVEQLFGLFNQKVDGDSNDSIKGIINAGDDTIGLDAEPPAVKDAALIAAAQAAEHYEIAEYGTLRAWAKVLGRNEALELIDWTLEEEKKADQTLTAVAAQLNFQAASAPRAR
ncbi:MAG TPA: ferritin-like domain-containing protein [Vicinamibacterales bacterium]|jgi:ferritin-like metal-binding protein YciE